MFHSFLRVIRSKKYSLFSPCFCQFFTAFPIFMPKSKLLPSIFTPSLFLKSDRSDLLLKRVNRYFALLLTKTSKMHEKPKSKFQTLDISAAFLQHGLCATLGVLKWPGLGGKICLLLSMGCRSLFTFSVTSWDNSDCLYTDDLFKVFILFSLSISLQQIFGMCCFFSTSLEST